MIASVRDLIAFLKDFHREWLADQSLDPALIPADLPSGLAMIYRELGALIALEEAKENDWRPPFSAQDCLLPVEKLERIDGMVEFAWENQGNWSCRCPLAPGDPPVYSDAADLWQEDQQGFVEVCGSLDHFLTTLCLQEAVMGSRHLYSLSGALPPDGMACLEPLWLGGQYVFEEPTHDFFQVAGTDGLLLRHAHEGMMLGSASIADPGEFSRKLGLTVSRLG